MQTPRTEFAQALRAIASERNLDADIIMETIKDAIVAAYRRDARERGEDTEEMEFEVEMDSVSGEAKIFAWPAEEPDKKEDVTPPGFGRIAAQTAKQVIHQKIREAEKGAIMEEFEDRVGGLISGMILRFDGPDVRVDLGRAEGIMPADERVPNERLNANQRLTFLLKEIEDTARGKKILLSRADPQFVAKLFEREVPEISSGSVEVKAIARESGVRTKMAVDSNQSGVDPVGSCVGQKGVRVQAVTNELGGERVDIIPWTEDLADLVKAALSPAEGLTVNLDKDEDLARVRSPEDQLSLAIGKDGQNARLAAKLTGVKIKILSLEGEEISGDSEKAAEGAEDEEKEDVDAPETEEQQVDEGEDQDSGADTTTAAAQAPADDADDSKSQSDSDEEDEHQTEEEQDESDESKEKEVTEESEKKDQEADENQQ